MRKSRELETFADGEKALAESRLVPKAADLDLVRAAVAKGGWDALKQIPPLALAAALRPEYRLDEERVFFEPCVEISPVVNPLLNSVLQQIGAVRRGERTYSISIGRDANPQILEAALDAIPACVCFADSEEERLARRGIYEFSAHRRADNLMHGPFMGTEIKARLHWGLYNRFHLNYPSDQTALGHCAVIFKQAHSQLWIRICTLPRTAAAGVHFGDESVDLNLYPVIGPVRDPQLVTADAAVAIIEHAAARGYPVLDPTETIGFLRERLAESVVAQRVPASPGMAKIVVGRKVLSIPGVELPAPEQNSTTRTVVVGAKQSAAIVERARALGLPALFHPHVADVAAMADPPALQIEGLRPYQNQAVALHLATEIGLVNASAPGLGKTVMALAAWRRKAASRNGWRGLVVAPAALLTQWSREAGRFFPEARTEIVTAKQLASGKAAAISQSTAAAPLLLICSYDTVRRAYDKLAELALDDLAVDEAAILKNPGSERSKALWELRRQVGCAIALTGTPIERSLDDLGRVLAWARNDEALFYGKRLSTRFDVTCPEQVEKLWEAIGPTVFRRDRSEIADELPTVNTEVVLLDPVRSEKTLADGAWREMRRYYEELLQKMEAVAAIDPDDPTLQQAKEDLQRARGAVLGGITLARMAASDPAALVSSNSAGALLLQAAGLIAPAVRDGGTKRKQVGALVAELIENGEAVLVFTDFSEVASSLAADFQAAGIATGLFTGGQSRSQRQASIDGFQGVPCLVHAPTTQAAPGCPDCRQPTLDCLVLTKSAREGLNLQRTTVLIHYDLPWIASEVVQRVGRAARFGAGHKQLQVLVPIMAGTVEERVARLVVERAVIALAALDTHRGVSGAQTEVGLAVGGIEDAVSDEQRKGAESIFEIAKEVLTGVSP